MVDTIDRFFEKIDMEPTSGCWLWNGARTPRGYGTLKVKGKSWGAHRWSARFISGLDITDKYVCHKCDNPICVNPDHLFVGSPLENTQDCKDKRRLSHGTTGPKKPRKGITHPRAKLTDEDVKAIRTDTRPTRELSEEFGVTKTHIKRIRSGTRRS